MIHFVLLALAGFAAQLVDGSLGMAYGVTSSTLLLAIGTNPAMASATVHLAEIGTTVASGVAHHRFGNVDWRVVARIGLPGAAGAFAGATVLSHLSTAFAGPVMAVILMLLGGYVLLRFTLSTPGVHGSGQRLPSRFLVPLGLLGGFLDATGGGGWGPVGTPALLASGRMEPRKVIGTVDTSEFLVAAAASCGFLLGLGGEGLVASAALALLLGGLVAAPAAAWLVRHLPARILGTAAGASIVLVNAGSLLVSLGVPTRWHAPVYAVLLPVTAAAVGWALTQHLRSRGVDLSQRRGAEAVGA